MPSFTCTVEESSATGIRLDRYAAEKLKILSRSQIKARKLEARVDGHPVKISRILKGGERLDLSWSEAEAGFLIPEDLPLDIVYEDDRVIVLNKAQGMVVHPGAGNRQGTLANALLYRRLQKAGFAAGAGGDFREYGLRPGIVHRLDKDTSGLIIAAWDEEAHAFLAEQFKAGKVKKTYAALVQGCPKEKSGFIDTFIVRSRKNRKIFTVSDKEGRKSLTWYKTVRSWGDYSLLLVRPRTGRTHQIRVHLKSIGNPVLGDPLYNSSSAAFSKKAALMLHAKRLSIRLPDYPGIKTFRTVFPERFRPFMKRKSTWSFQ